MRDQRDNLARVENVRHRPKRVLVIEDDADIRELLVEVLCKDGYEVFAVADGAPAIRLLEETAMDVILLDLILKSVHGVEVLAWLWAAPAAARVPVIIVSGRNFALEPALRRKVADFVPKPLSLPRLMQSVRRATGSANP